MRYIPKNIPLRCVVAALIHASAVQAQTPEGATEDNVFMLGQIAVVGEVDADAPDVSGDSTITADEIWKFNVNSLTEAVRLVPGVSSTFVSNGRRNEGDISVRGFDRWRVPLSIDGIRVYLPADNRLDFNRFLTADLAEVQIKKGYASVLDGPGAMGGSINLVTRKPTREFEAEVQGGSSFDNSGSYEGWFGTAIAGTRHDSWYLQGSASELKRDHWTLSDDFTPVGPAEDGGERNGSDTRDWRINLKAGFTPNETDEYSLSFTKQSGVKNAPLGVDFLLPNGTVRNPPYQPNNFWTWPYWDVQSVYFLSQTGLGETGYVKTRLFYNEFDNSLWAWDDINYRTQSLAGRFQSFYTDNSVGGSVETGASLLARNTTRMALHWRRDRHSEYNINRPTHPTLATTEPPQNNEEQTWSIALENTWNASDAVDLIVGISYDRNELKQAQEFNTTAGLFSYPLGGSDAFNWQTALQWHYTENAQLGASISSRSRFPNNFERFSTRFGTARPNPDLATERAINYEINWKGTLADSLQLGAAVFYNDIQDLIQTVIVQATPQITQGQNVGDGAFSGVEVSADWQVSAQWRVGANYSYLDQDIKDPLQPNLKPTGSPGYLGFAYVAWAPVESFSIQPSVELASDRWTDRNGSAGLGYQRIGSYTLLNLQLQYRPVENVEAIVGGRNLLDENFELAAGFPEPGRSLFAKVRVTF